MTDILPIHEFYACIQGEGKLQGVPSFLVRFSGCRLRCQFKESFCDSSFSSWKPEKGKYTIKDLEREINLQPQIRHVIISGGGPTLHGDTLVQVCSFFKKKGFHVTMETEGSEFVATEADLISLSPKLISSKPKLGSINPYTEQVVTQKIIDQHEKWRCNYDAMKKLIKSHDDFYLKFVVTGNNDIQEIVYIAKQLDLMNAFDKIYLMPEGVDPDKIQDKMSEIFDLCIEFGFRYSDRLHIRAFGDKRFV